MKEREVIELLNCANLIPINPEWENIQNFFSLSFPYDYKILIEKLGGFDVFSFMYVVDPFNGKTNFEKRSSQMTLFLLETYMITKSIEDVSRTGFSINDYPDGRFPIGGTENGEILFYNIVDFSLCIGDSYLEDFEETGVGLSEFLRKFITGEFIPEAFSRDVLERQGWPLKDT